MAVDGATQFQDYDDAELVREIKIGSQEAFNILLERYTGKINYIASRFYCRGMTCHDYFQEGAIGLFVAARKYQADRGSTFRIFAELHIRGAIINATKCGTRKKYSPLNHSYSLDPCFEGEGGPAPIEFLRNSDPTPEEILIRKHNSYELRQQLHKSRLTALERKVLLKLSEGSSYREAADELGVEVKSIDNAFRRAKKKLINLQPVELFA